MFLSHRVNQNNGPYF